MISFSPTSALASSAASPEEPAFSTVVSSTTLLSEEAVLVASWVLEASRFPESLEEPSEVCPPHAAARSEMMQKRITTAGYFLLRLFPNFLLRLSALKDATFYFFSGTGICRPEDTMDLGADPVSAALKRLLRKPWLQTSLEAELGQQAMCNILIGYCWGPTFPSTVTCWRIAHEERSETSLRRRCDLSGLEPDNRHLE